MSQEYPLNVMSESQREELLSFRDKPLAIPLYSSRKRTGYYLEDFLSNDSFKDVIWEVFDGEADITDHGKRFLKDFLGFEKSAILLKDVGFTESEKELETWIDNLVPNEIGDFITEARNKPKDNE